MPWVECIYMEDRFRCSARFLDRKKMALLCREFDISRKTGYQNLNGYKDCGLDRLADRDC